MSAAFVNAAGGTSSGSVTTVAKAYTPSSAANTLIVVVSAYNASFPTLSLTDTAGNTFGSAVVAYNNGSAGNQAVFLVPSCLGSASTWTGHSSSSCTGMNIDIYEYSGMDSSGTLDGTPAHSTGNASGRSPNAGSMTTSVANSCLFAFGYDQSDGNLTGSVSSTSDVFSSIRLNNQNTSDGETSSGFDALGVAAGNHDVTMLWTGGTSRMSCLFGVKTSLSPPDLLGQICL